MKNPYVQYILKTLSLSIGVQATHTHALFFVRNWVDRVVQHEKMLMIDRLPKNTIFQALNV